MDQYGSIYIVKLLIGSFNRFKSLLLLDDIVFASLLKHPEMIMERLGRHYMVVLIFWIQIRAFKNLWNRMVQIDCILLTWNYSVRKYGI